MFIIRFRQIVFAGAATMLFFLGALCTAEGQNEYRTRRQDQLRNGAIRLPDPATKNGAPLNEAIYERRCIRSFFDEPLTLDHLGQLLWAGNGSRVDAVSGPTRTAPSAGGLYPVELFVIAGDVRGLEAGVYAYTSDSHALLPVKEGDLRADLTEYALMQRFIGKAPATIVIAAVYERTTRKYGERGRERYVHMDAGHAAQNIFLQVTALGLGTTTVGAFRDRGIKQLLDAEKAEPLYLMPVGIPAE
jgi:SagB-type dehydrogenase family enzyme